MKLFTSSSSIEVTSCLDAVVGENSQLYPWINVFPILAIILATFRIKIVTSVGDSPKLPRWLVTVSSGDKALLSWEETYQPTKEAASLHLHHMSLLCSESALNLWFVIRSRSWDVSACWLLEQDCTADQTHLVLHNLCSVRPFPTLDLW